MRSLHQQPLVRRLATTLGLGLSLLSGASARAEAGRQATIIARVFSYDYQLRARAGDALVVAVVFKPGDALSESSSKAWLEAFRALSGTKVQGLPLSAVRLAFTTSAQLRAAVAAQGIDVLLVCEHLEPELEALKELSRSKKLLTVGAHESYLPLGLTLGVFAEGARNVIEVNLTAATAENVAFSSDLLRLAKILR